MRLIRSEWTKLRSVRGTWLLAGSTVPVTAAIGLVGILGTAGEWQTALNDQWDPTAISLKGILVGQLLVAMVGASAITSEYSTGMIVASLSVVPQRGRLLAAKVGAAALLVVPTAIISVAVAFGLGQLAIAQAGVPAASVTDPGVLAALLGAAGYLALVGVLGLALGTITRSSTGTLGVIVVVALLAPAFIPALPGAVGEWLATYWPTSAGQMAYTVIQTGSLAPPEGAAVLGVFAVCATAVSYVLLRLRDA
ncbi:ABC transporter permease [Demequina aestuarii]|uniref:ABC transporter permease n=1 Tax=Demequina aestuarii TaxID=327095 RepID=UPI0007846208|nr:ABC transporter permease [Demequina aestuarii]